VDKILKNNSALNGQSFALGQKLACHLNTAKLNTTKWHHVKTAWTKYADNTDQSFSVTSTSNTIYNIAPDTRNKVFEIRPSTYN